MVKKEINTSLSARVSRRNAQGFKGKGTKRWIKTTPFGNYDDETQNHKDVDYKASIVLKNRNGYKFRHFRHRHIMSKRYADNHQKL